MIFSQVVSDYIYIGHTANATAGAVVSQQGSNWCLYHNPSGLTDVKDIQLSRNGFWTNIDTHTHMHTHHSDAQHTRGIDDPTQFAS